MATVRITRSGARRVPQAQAMESPPPAVRTAAATPEHGEEVVAEYTEDVLKSPALRKYKRRRSNLGMAARIRTPSKTDDVEETDENKDPQTTDEHPVLAGSLATSNAAAEPPIEKTRNRVSSILNSHAGVTLKRGDTESYSRFSSIFSDRDSNGKRKYSSTSSDGSESSRGSASEEELKHRCWKVDDFSLGKPLGRGKYGNVYHGKEKITKFHLAIKILFKDRFVQEEALYILKREVSIQYRLRHRHIVSLYGCFEDKKNLYLLLEFCGQGELFKQLRKHRHLPESDARRYIAQLADALKYMHARNVIHRDIKPENMLLADDGSLKIADFGWAVHAPPPYNVRRTLCGTPEYLAPEMLNRSGHTWAVDIWGLGIMAYELLCGHTPFVEKSRSPAHGGEPGQEEDKTDKLQQIYDRINAYQDDITLPHAVIPGLSREAEEFIRSCVTNNPAARPSAAALLESPWLAQAEI